MRKAVVSGNVVMMKFPYDEEIVAKIKKRFRFREWVPDKRVWEIIIVTRLEKEIFESLIQAYGFQVEYEEPLCFNEASLWEDHIRVYYVDDLDPEEKMALKKYLLYEDNRLNCWKLSISKGSLEAILKFAESGKIVLSEGMKKKFLQKLAEILQAIEKSQRVHADFEVPGLKKTLYPFQKAGVLYLIEKGRVLLADEMGLGKTIQAIAAVVYQKAFPCLVICPASLKYNWQREVFQATDCSCYVVNGKNGVREADFVIINYDLLNKYKDILHRVPFQALIVDESHYIKNPRAQRTKAVLELAQTIRSRNGKIYLLTGTPILNRPVELLPQLKALGVLEKIAKKEWDYLKRYCGAYQDRYGWHFDGASHVQELQEKLRAACMIRREKKDVLSELPEKVRNVQYLKVHDTEYEELEKKFERETDINKKLGYISRLYTAAGKAKIPDAIEWVENFFENYPGKKLVVFAYHVEVQNGIYEELRRKGYKVVKLTSEMSSEARHEAVRRFQEDPAVQIIVVSLRAGGEGITLTAADTVLFVEPYWVPAILTQAEDRLHRISQRSTVMVYYLLATNTIDMAVWSVASEKEQIFAELTKGIELTELQEAMKKLLKEFGKRDGK